MRESDTNVQEMALQIKESSHRSCNGMPQSEESDSLSHRPFRVRSLLEKSGNSEVQAVKFHSPPPKPPRRRNSGHRVVTPIGCSTPKNCSEVADESSSHQSPPLSSDPSVLLEEVKMLREMNEQLWKHLCSTQTKLDQLQNGTVSPEAENVSSPSFAELLTTVYYAQKEKEDLIEAKLQAALSERDAAIRELDEIGEVLGRNFEEAASNGDVGDISGKTIKELLKDVESTQDPAKLMQQRHLLLAHLFRERKGKLNSVSPDLKSALVEKNNALSMVHHLEEELNHWKQSSDGWHRDTKQWESSLLDILCQVISQRDSACQEVNRVQEELNSLQQCFRQQNRTGDAQMNLSFEGVQTDELYIQCHGNCRIHCTSSEVSECDDLGDNRKGANYSTSERTPSSEISLLKSKVAMLTQTLQSEMKARQLAEESCRRLERLVCVLRKKVNGLHVGVQV